MLQRLGDFKRQADHPGLDFTRLANDIFQLEGQYGTHYCIASDLQGNSLSALQRMFPNSMLPKAMVKSLVHRLLFSVNWLHATCGTIHTGEPVSILPPLASTYPHTDITPQNVLTAFQSPPSLEDSAGKELDDFGAIENPSVSSPVSDKYQILGIPVLNDFGQMRLMDSTNTDWCMPDLYRAPEMLLGLPWSFPVDVWSIGVMVRQVLPTSLSEAHQ